MVKVIMGKKGTGKTKQLIEMVNRAASEDNGSIVCIEGGRKLTYDISYAVRLIDVCDYPLTKGYDTLFAFICGIYSQNFDVSHIFIDSLYKVSQCEDLSKAEKFISDIEAFSSKNNVSFTIMVSDDIENAGEALSKFF